MNADMYALYFKALLENTHDLIYFKDLQGRFVLCSRNLAPWCGFDSQDRILGKTDADLFSAEHARETRADEVELIEGRKNFIFKEEHKTWDDGRSAWLSTIKMPLRDRRGRMLGTFGVSRDITARKQVELELIATDARLHLLESIIDQSPAVVFYWDFAEGWPVRYVSNNVRNFGYLPEEFLSGLRTYEEIIHPDDRTMVQERMKGIRASEQSRYQLTYRILRRDGTTRWVDEFGLLEPESAGAGGSCRGIVLDITDRRIAEEHLEKNREELERRVEHRTRDLRDANRKMEEEIARRRASEDALRLSEQRYRRLFESVTSYVYSVAIRDGQPVSTRHGAGCEAVTGYQPEDYENRPYLWIDMVHSEDRDAVIRQTASVARGEDPPPIEHRIIHRSGNVRWVRNTVVAHRDAEGRLISYDGIVQDITERQSALADKLNAQREAMEAQQRELLERADRLSALGMLAAGVAHEVNNPLQGMLTHLEAVRKALPPDFARARSLDMVGRGIESIAALVQRLLWLGSGKTDDREASNFSDAVSFVVDLMGSELQKQKVRIDVRARTLHVLLPIPHREMVQVLINLIGNARDAMPEGGVITITCDRQGSEAVICVADTGPGIPPQEISRIFTPFYSTKGAKGAGLGLSVAHSIVGASHGTLWAECRPGEGARLYMRFPVAEEPHEKVAARRR
ncbi:MAG: PAS domain S-box protein [Kiritimatiellae bacterium]|nr:PAS domain S-box protein [Kiritimatiellia bacterium]